MNTFSQTPLAHWTFNETHPENRTFNDQTGNEHHAICSEDLDYTSGRKGYAIDIPEEGFSFHIANSEIAFATPEFSIEAFINIHSLPESGITAVIFSHQTYEPNVAQGFSLEINSSGNIVISMGLSGSWIFCTGNESIAAANWYHIVGTYDGSTIRLYVNGTLDNSLPHAQGYASPHQDASIGCQENTAGITRNGLNGYLDDLFFYDTTLSPDTIARHADSYNVTESGLIAHWSFDSASDNTVFYDITQNGFDAVCSTPLVIPEGVNGNALKLTDTGYTLSVNNAHPDFSVPSFTIEGWIYSYIDIGDVSSFFNFKSIFSYQSFTAATAKGFHLDITDAGLIRLSLSRNDQAQITCAGTTVLQPNKWYHVAGTYNGSSLCVYVNGLLETEVEHSGGYILPDQDATIACRTRINEETAQNWFNGMIDDLKLFRVALPSDSILAHFEEIQIREEPPFEINLGMKTVYALPGDTVTLPVFIANHEDYTIEAGQLSIQFDEDKLEMISCSNDDGIINDWDLFTWNMKESGLAVVAFGSASSSLTYGDGELFNCTFAVNENVPSDDTCKINLRDINIDENNSLIVTTRQDGRIIVEKKTLLYGDVTGNNEINVFDAQKILSYVVGALTLPDDVCCPNFTTKTADVSGNGNISSYDAALILQYGIGLIPYFPVEKRSRFSKRTAKEPSENESATFTQRADLKFIQQKSPDKSIIYDLIGTNLKGFIGGDFQVGCDASDDCFRQFDVNPYLRGALCRTMYDSSISSLKIALSNTDDIDDNNEILLLRITLPPPSGKIPELTIQKACINDGSIQTAFCSENSNPIAELPVIRNSSPSQISLRNGILFFAISDKKPSRITIYDLQGRQLLQKYFTISSTIPTGSFSRGSYIYTLRQGTVSKSGRFIVVR